jgi:hypothetical protein
MRISSKIPSLARRAPTTHCGRWPGHFRLESKLRPRRDIRHDYRDQLRREPGYQRGDIQRSGWIAVKLGRHEHRRSVPSGATTGPILVTVNALASSGVNFTVLPLRLPSRTQVVAAIENVNNYWIANNKPGNGDWDQATYFTGDLAAYDAIGQANYLSFAQSWASENNYSLIGGNTTAFAD